MSSSPPSRTFGQRLHVRQSSVSDDIDFEIQGNELQFVEIELDPGESAIAEAGAMVWKEAAISMETIFGDGSKSQSSGVVGSLLGAGKRLITGESLFTTQYTNNGHSKARVAFSAPVPGCIVPLKLSEHGGKLICQKDSFLSAAKGVSLGIHFQKKIMTGLFGGEGFIMQKLTGDGWVFVQFGGTVIERELAAGEVLHVDTGCLAAYEPSVDFDLITAGGVKSWLFGGEGVFFGQLTGPGKVWIQSLPFSRLAGRVIASSGVTSPSSVESSVLDGLGSLIDGNR